MTVTTKYPFIRRARLSHSELAVAFGFKTVQTFRSSSAQRRYMNAIESILRLLQQKELENLKKLLEM